MDRIAISEAVRPGRAGSATEGAMAMILAGAHGPRGSDRRGCA